MSRDITAGVVSAIESDVIRPVAMVRLEYDTGHVAVNTSDRSFTWAGKEYFGVGDLGKIEPVSEDIEIQTSRLSLSLSGLADGVISRALGEHYQGRPVVVYLAFLDADYALIDEPTVIFRGRIDNQVITLDQTATVTVTCESVLADWDRPRELRYNNETHQATYPGDKFFEFVEQAVNKEIPWGNREKRFANS